ncbi:multidrug transporter AcrB [Ahniella affigens]|uniref:Multidrug transporter AcrB n=1 Tax=Ahniella affigens TaxID=2021234 RepID=A0A2P1PTA2_9GAMM|nr:efflux RND transporter permease subunit [Ahniella affigens]AVP98061.1 multidrug transporter AcrB [Ahniella affigens]
MLGFNLSEWALRNRTLVLYFAIVLAVIGVFSYQRLGQSEDPPFTFKVMVIRTLWPGATAEQVSLQVTDRIEGKLQELPELEWIRSYSRPGESQVFVMAKDSLRSDHLPELFYQVRKKVSDIRVTLPQGTVGPFFNDEFGDTFGNIYALIGDGYDYALLKSYAERVQLQLLRVPDVAKVELIGLQEERIYVEISNAKLATFGISFAEAVQQLEAQNAVTAAGSFETAVDRIYIRTTGAFDSVDAIRNISIRAGQRVFRLGDVAEVRRDFVDPPSPRMRFQGRESIGIAVAMKRGGDIVRLGQSLDQVSAQIADTLPVGLELQRVADQPKAVRSSIAEFVRTLAEAVIIVLAVSFFSLGFRTGLVVALSIPLVLAMTFASMYYFGIGLHKISLGALVLALGLLVDDAIIAVEMMAVKLEQGYDRIRAAAFAYTTTAFPMLTGTLITAAGFLPIATAQSGTGEYTRSIFQVVTIALILSWIAAVIFIPYLGYRLLPEHGLGADDQKGAHDPYDGKFYQRFKGWLEWCLDNRRTVILATIAIFLVSGFSFRFVQQQFFPASTRLELMVDLKLPEGSSIHSTERAVAEMESFLDKQEGVQNYVAYVGTGSPRFYLPLDQQLPAASFAQFVVLTENIEAREALRAKLIHLFEERFTELRGRVTRLENGPPVGFPIQFRVSGEHVPTVRKIARQIREIMRDNGNISNAHLDWEEPSKVIRLAIDQDRARVMGISSQDLADFLRSSISGSRITQYREGNELIDVMLRGPNDERAQLSMLDSLSIPTASGKSVSLAQVAKIQYSLEEGILWRRNRLPTITVRGDIYGALQPPTVTAQVEAKLATIRAELPPGYLIEIGGTVEDSGKGSRSVAAGMPLFILVVLTLLMLQLKSFARTALVFATAPLGIIGVVLFLLVFNVPFGFVAMLGTIALAGMIMRNSVILVDQIDQDIEAGHSAWDAVVGATIRRFRPIVLTALAAILAMIPLARSVFYGPMAVAIMGGLIVATALTLLFLPALYAWWFKVERPPVRPEELGSDPWPGDEIEVRA